jgi:hypothetical protein
MGIGLPVSVGLLSTMRMFSPERNGRAGSGQTA